MEVMDPSAVPFGSSLIVGANGTVVFGQPRLGASMFVRRSIAVSAAGVVAAIPEPAACATGRGWNRCGGSSLA